jgi:AcrR family transcriptional regulator
MVVDKREHIIQKSLELFAEKGFEGTSIRDIATLADVNVAMVNYYFGSKEKLFESIVSHRASYMKDMLQELVNDASKTEMEKIDTIIDAYVNRLLSQPAFHRLVHQELLIAKRGLMHEQLINIFASNTLFFKQIIEQGIRKKQFRKVDAELTMASLIGTINQVLLSKSMCNILLQSKEDFNPYTDPVFKKRLIKHLQQMIHAHLTIS